MGTGGSIDRNGRNGRHGRTNNSNNNNSDKSPFFAPATPRVIAETPGGTKRAVKQRDGVKERKSTIVGATANLINAIVGSGIVGIPFAIQQAGLVAGIGLVCLCAVLTDKSLRLLVETAKHSSATSYETTMEAAFGRNGFLFVCINMFIMSYGAMVSYLMIVKDTLPYVLGVSDLGMRRALLCLISLAVMVPLSAQRDMANLAKTSRISVVLDICMVGLVAYIAPIADTLATHGGITHILRTSTLRLDTVFVGLGVLSFAFVCQHSAFIIAGSLERPTKVRWSTVTMRSLWLCAFLANLCGIGGYLGYMETTEGNILNNLPPDQFLPNLARGLLGVTMLFVFPMESFVARHVCVVTLFQGRRAHEGDDASILNRRDRRITLTVALYILALVPAVLFQNMGNVLSVTGAIGGSCLSYIGPGAVYIGIHGAALIKMANDFWKLGPRRPRQLTDGGDPERLPLQGNTTTSATNGNDTPATATETVYEEDAILTRFGKAILWYVFGMPVWYAMAKVGAEGFQSYTDELTAKSPHPSRLGQIKKPPQPQPKKMVRAGSVSSLSYHNNSTGNGGPHIAIILPPTKPSVAFSNKQQQQQLLDEERRDETQDNDDVEAEDDPQDTPQVMDFVIAVGFCLFGLVALGAGLLSIFVAQTQ